MPWTVGTFHKAHWYQAALPWIAVAIIASLGFLSFPRAQQVYQRWSENRRIVRAGDAFAAGKYEQAIVDAKAALTRNPHCIEATRIIAKSLEAMNVPQALLVRRRIDSLTSGDVENTLAYAAGLWHVGDPVTAERALEDLPASERGSGRYHELAARVAAHQRDTAGALAHWQEAVRLNPGDENYALELAATRLVSTAPGDRDTALEQLNSFTANPTSRLAALRVLLSDAGRQGETSRSLELSMIVSTDPAATFPDRLRQLAVLQVTRHADFERSLAQLQESAAASPEQLSTLVTWMNQHSLALLVPEWTGRLTPEALSAPQIRAALAETDARASNWASLRERLESETWGNLEVLRLAHLSRALGRLGDENGAIAAWARVTTGAQADARLLEILGRTVLDWGWKVKAEELLSKLAAFESCPRWAADFLWAAALQDGDSSRLYAAARVLLKTDPKNLPARNNFVALALLTGQDGDSPRQIAETLFQQHPADPFVVKTHGLSLYQQGRAVEAVRLMQRFTPEELRLPPVALYHGIFLAGAGQTAAAQEYLAAGSVAPMLAEEKALFARARGTAPAASTSSLDRSRTDTAQLFAENRQAFLTDPKNVTARSNYVLLALLTGQSLDSARQLARAHFNENPHLADIAAIYGFVLYQEGRVEEAIALMATFTAEQLRSPSASLYAGLFLASAGRRDEAAPFLQVAANAALLPEEKILLTRAQAEAPAPGIAPRPMTTVPPAAPLVPVTAIDRTRSDTARLYSESRQAFLAEPKNLVARSNYILLALLTGQNVDSARALARALHTEHATDPVVTSIHGLSLDQQGKSAEAVALMETLKSKQLREPWVALYYGHFLANNHQPEQAATFLALAEKIALLPEERAFLPAVDQEVPAANVPSTSPSGK